jgi:hypothetical protein
LRSIEWGWLVLLVIALVAPFGAKAQIGGTATIQGTVSDPTGAVIVGANVTAQNVATGVKLTRIADKAGFYVLSPLDVGDYTITITAKGFEKLIRENIHVDGMQVLGLNLTLQVGSATIAVTVTDVPPVLETENATLGSVMENQVYQSLPLEMGSPGHQDQRRATDFAALMPGVSANETKNDETDEPMVVNGNANSSEMYIEGIPATSVSVAGDPRYIWSAFSVETVDQFQLKTSAYSAEYRGLGIENFTVKSAGNKFHGSVYGVVRNTAFDAAGFIPSQYPANYPNAQLAGTWYKAPEHQNEYGISLGGPIWRNKIFLFANYMGFRFSTVTTPSFQSIPTERMRVGDFSELLSQSTPIQIFDPITQTCVSTKNCSRTQFTGTSAYDGTTGPNIIPANEVSPIAKEMSALLPTPTNSSISNNYVGSYMWGLNNWSQTERLDADLSQKQKISVIFGAGRQGLVGTSGSQATNVAPLPYKYAKVYAPITKDGIFEHTYVISDFLVNQFKYTIMQYYSPAINPTLNTSAWAASGFGITDLPTGQAANSFPIVKWGSSDEAQWGPQASAGNVTNNFTLLDNMQWVHGKHSLTFGGQYQWLQYNYNADRTGSSPLTLTAALSETEGFSGNNTVTAAKNTGFDYASFMVGAIDSATYTVIEPSALETGTRFHPFALYVNDDYKLTSKLTVNAGLRWDVIPPFTEEHDRFSFMNPAMSNPYTGTSGALQLAGFGANSCSGHTPINTYYKNFGPRLSFAYATNDKTVIRASLGMYYALGGGTGGSAVSSQPDKGLEIGFSAAPNPTSPGVVLPAFYLNGNSNLSADAGHKVLTYLNDPTNTAFNNGASVTAPGAATQGRGYGTYYSTAVPTSSPDYISSTLGYLDPKFGGRSPEFTGWSFGVQRSLTKDMTATISYVGNEGHHILATGSERGYYANQMDPKYLTLGAALSNTATAANLTAAGLSLPYPSFPTSQKISQMLLPFPQYKGVTDEVGAVSNSNYNSMQLTIDQRLAHGLTLMLNYTFSKSIDNAGTFRSGYDIPADVSSDGKAYAQGKADRSLSVFDQRHNVTGTTTYDLPFGRGHIGSGNAIVRSVAGGWRVSGIFTYFAGNPLTITQGSCSGITGQGTCMPAYAPNFSGPVRINGGWGHGASRTTLGNIQYINPAAFALTGTGGSLANPYVIGSVARTAPYGLRGPGNYNIDASVRRTFDLWNRENVKFVFEANSFNALNHVWFGSTSSNATGSIGQSLTTVTPNSSSNTASSFGTVAGQANTPRVFQFAGHITF